MVRVDLPRLDDLIRIVGEMVIKRSRFEDELNRLSQKGHALDLVVRRARRRVRLFLAPTARGDDDGGMVPVAENIACMPFVLRDLARESDKKARLRMEGQQTEIDKYLIEQLKDPLLHLVRNSFSHGCGKRLAERSKANKPEEATITLFQSVQGDSVTIVVGDDGRGMNVAAILRRAAELGSAIPPVMDKTALLEILCAAGFSTRTDADRGGPRGGDGGCSADGARTRWHTGARNGGRKRDALYHSSAADPGHRGNDYRFRGQLPKPSRVPKIFVRRFCRSRRLKFARSTGWK